MDDSTSAVIGGTRSGMPGICGGYNPTPGVFDEMMTPEGSLRPHWRGFVDQLAALGEKEVARGHSAAERMLHENGITYNVHGDSDGGARPWDLDMVPLLISPEDWRLLESGLMQRARLMNATLADLYGPQRLLRENVLPATLVFADPDFLRTVHGVVPRGGVFLHTYSVDLGRSPDGRWWVLNDLTDASAGSGYALENRIILSRCLPDLFWSSQATPWPAITRRCTKASSPTRGRNSHASSCCRPVPLTRAISPTPISPVTSATPTSRAPI